jgi:hypothetical protein
MSSGKLFSVINKAQSLNMVNFTNNLAIAIGINSYRNNIAELKTARPDAEKLADLLENTTTRLN